MEINKRAVFKEELEWIVDSNIRDTVADIIEALPEYFFFTAASSTGKYHPAYALGNGGLVRHTKAAVMICHELLQLEYNKNKFTDEQADLMIAALILHDGMKHGLNNSAYTVAEHPIVIADYIKSNYTEKLGNQRADFLTRVISSHMGQWNTLKTPINDRSALPKPSDECEYFVHMCDYLASRKYLDVLFDKRYNPDNYVVNETHGVSVEVRDFVSKIISKCKNLITERGIDREELYNIIAQHNNGVKNPNAIKSIEVCNAVWDDITKHYDGEEK